jgi:hypothetical protein
MSGRCRVYSLEKRPVSESKKRCEYWISSQYPAPDAQLIVKDHVPYIEKFS